MWGLDMVRPLKKAPGGFTHLLVAIDKFTKWIEAKPITTIDSKEAVKFFLDIVYRFGVPNSIINDNRTNFTGHYFQDSRKDTGPGSIGRRSDTHAQTGKSKELTA